MTWTPTAVAAPFLLDPKVKELIRVFEDAGHGDKLRFVGGCVRNVLMNLPQSDIDIATPLVPEQVQNLFEAAGYHVHPTGIEHGTVTVVIQKEPFEITTLRRDVETDGRRAVIAYTEDWAEDAHRRDFRCNALYMDAQGRLYDYVNGGIKDAMERRLVFVGDATTRIREDYLRILRLFRFMATLNASVDESAIRACSRLAHGLESISGERIEKEMMKLLAAENPHAAIRALADAYVFEEAFPGIEQPMCSDLALEHIIKTTRDPALRLACLYDMDQFAARETFDRWKSAKALQDRVMAALDGFCHHRAQFRPEITMLAYRVGMQATRDRMLLSWAEGWNNGRLEPPIPASVVIALADDIEANLPVFSVKGADVLACGVQPGKQVGQLLRDLEAWWIKNGYPDRDATLARLGEMVEVAA